MERMPLMSRCPSLVWRRVTPQDLGAWLELLHAAYARNLQAGMNFTAATMTSDQGGSVLARHRVWGGYVGSDLVATFTLRQDDEGWHVNFLGVHPAYQRLGCGKLALSEAEAQARSLGVQVLLLDTAEVHPWLLEYYQRQGYLICGQKQWPGKAYRSVCFHKLL